MEKTATIYLCDFCSHVYGHKKKDGTMHRNISKSTNCGGSCDPVETQVTYDKDGKVSNMKPGLGCLTT